MLLKKRTQPKTDDNHTPNGSTNYCMFWPHNLLPDSLDTDKVEVRVEVKPMYYNFIVHYYSFGAYIYNGYFLNREKGMKAYTEYIANHYEEC